MSHTPFLYAPAEEWLVALARRNEASGLAAPAYELDEARNLHRRCMAAIERLRGLVSECRPDLIVVIGDDQQEQFQLSGLPQFAVYIGEEFSGYRTLRYGTIPYPGSPRVALPRTEEHWTTVRSDPAFARYTTSALVAQGFDVAFSLEPSDAEAGMGHAIMRPLHYLTPELDVPVVPVLVNCYFAPQPPARRCVRFGEALGALIDQHHSSARVLVIGSGGLWHTPNAPGATLNEAFDHAVLDALRRGDVDGAAEVFDSHRAGEVDPVTGMAGGLGSGTGEVRNWIVAASTAPGSTPRFVDYVPIVASPVGAAFAYWSLS